MSDFAAEPADITLRFPDPHEEAYQRAQEFRQLTPEGRFKEITALMAWGLNMARSSPRRAAIEERWAIQEAEWQQIQQELFAQHGQ